MVPSIVAQFWDDKNMTHDDYDVVCFASILYDPDVLLDSRLTRLDPFV
jgi:hypothetical protein